MRSLSEILLPTEFSPYCADVARYAAGVARHFGSKITLLHVLAPLNTAFAAFGSAGMLEEVLEHQRQETCSSLNLSFADELRGMAVKRIVAEGDAAATIAAYCASERVGLVMMPTRGCSAFRRYLLGSVTAKVLHDVNCPVWTSSHVTGKRSDAAVIPKAIVCAIDRTWEGGLILKWAAGLAADLDARLIAAHAIPSLEFHLEGFPGGDMRRALVEEAHARMSKVLESSRMPGAEVRVEAGSVPAVVRSVVADSRADLLIIGRAARPRSMGRLRTHSYALIRESRCPVLSI
jgi:nucleotide-binding universal stress UspA family protein